MKFSKWKVLIGLLVSSALIVSGGAPAIAAPDVIDPTKTTTLNIHKYEGEPGDTSTPLPGVTFKVQKINGVDLTKNAGWETLSGLTAEDLADGQSPSGVSLRQGVDLTTNDEGLATTDQLGVGAFLVTEQQFGSYTVAKPFIVTLPHENTDGTWNYTQDVHPKNQNVHPTKTVDSTLGTDGVVSIGKDLTYTINAPLPAEPLKQVKITDKLVDGLKLVTDSVAVTTVGGTVDLAATTDYTVTTENNTLVVNFTKAGLAKLSSARQSNSSLAVQVAFKATVVSVPDNGVIPNTAEVVVNGSKNNTDNPETKDPASTTFAPLTITKKGPSGTANSALNGAKFEIYRCKKQNDDTYALEGNALNVATEPTGPLGTVFTTSGGVDGGAAATANAYAIPAMEYDTNETATTTFQYCVLETDAPDGFVRNPEPQPVTYDAEKNQLKVDVQNQKDSIGGQLPATGAMGIGLFLLVGLALVARGIIGGRRRDDEEPAKA